MLLYRRNSSYRETSFFHHFPILCQRAKSEHDTAAVIVKRPEYSVTLPRIQSLPHHSEGIAKAELAAKTVPEETGASLTCMRYEDSQGALDHYEEFTKRWHV